MRQKQRSPGPAILGLRKTLLGSNVSQDNTTERTRYLLQQVDELSLDHGEQARFESFCAKLTLLERDRGIAALTMTGDVVIEQRGSHLVAHLSLAGAA